MKRSSSSPPSDRSRSFLGTLRLTARYVFDRRASLVGKLVLLGAVAYLVVPVDLVPDAVPVIGWLDDVGVFAAAWAIFRRFLNRWEAETGTLEAPLALPEGTATTSPVPVEATVRRTARRVE